MTTDPTPHTERAAAAAAEISDVWSLASVENPCGCEECTEIMAAIIAKHFNDDAAKLQADEWADAMEARARELAKELISERELAENEQALRQLAERKHDALRLAAGRALRWVKDYSTAGRGPNDEQEFYCPCCQNSNLSYTKLVHMPTCELSNAITALSDALAGEQMGKEAK